MGRSAVKPRCLAFLLSLDNARRETMRFARSQVIFWSTLLLLLLSACGRAPAQPSPTHPGTTPTLTFPPTPTNIPLPFLPNDPDPCHAPSLHHPPAPSHPPS